VAVAVVSQAGDQRKIGRLMMRLTLLHRQFRDVGDLLRQLSDPATVPCVMWGMKPELDAERFVHVRERLQELLLAVKLELELTRKALFEAGTLNSDVDVD